MLVWMGNGLISVTSDRLRPTNLQVQVVGAIVIALCLIGGLFGGLVLFFASGGSPLQRRLIVGSGGIVLSYLWLRLPAKAQTALWHTTTSVCL